MTAVKINILGDEYVVLESSENENYLLKGCDGYCDWTTKEIVLERDVVGDLTDMDAYKRKVLRHEIVHAFFVESGLHECAGHTDSWALNEMVVDWIARQGQKIYRAWKEAGALDD